MRELARTTFSASRDSGAVFVTCDLPLFKLPERFQGSYPPGLSDANPRVFDAPTDRGEVYILPACNQEDWFIQLSLGRNVLGTFAWRSYGAASSRYIANKLPRISSPASQEAVAAE